MERYKGLAREAQADFRGQLSDFVRLYAFLSQIDLTVTDRLQDIVDTNFDFYKRVTDDPAFAKHLLDWLFARFRKAQQSS